MGIEAVSAPVALGGTERMNHRTPTERLTKEELDRFRERVKTDGVARVSRRLGVCADVVYRVLADIDPVHRRTAQAVRLLLGA